MNAQKITSISRRIKELGFTGLATWSKTAYLKRLFAFYYKKKALAKRAHHQWNTIARHHRRDESFAQFFALTISNRIFDRMLLSPKVRRHIPSNMLTNPNVFKQADALTQNIFSILGSPEQQYTDRIPWHADIKQPQNLWGTEYWNKIPFTFYQDIHAQSLPPSHNIYAPDIKVPWELSRMHHLFILGLACQRAQESGNLEQAQKYSSTFVTHLDSWITHNPYLLGVNWVCPMEVAIRAINIIVALQFFKQSSNIPLAFWEKLTCSLYDHAIYLRYNQETSDRPNNHYIADLVGQFFLSLFFKELTTFNQQQQKILDTIWEQLQHQIQPDGSSYEGSTHYHKLVIEMLELVTIICELQNIKIPLACVNRMHMMRAFLEDCTDLGGHLAQIGDNDGGKCLIGYATIPNHHPRVLQYRWAGMSIIHSQGWHCTLRHPTFSHHQPSGHFHHDELSLTLSLDGHQLLIDPGTFLYTGNSYQRNYLKTAHAHNTFYIKDFEPPLSSNLFFTERTIDKEEAHLVLEKENIFLECSHQKYQKKGLTAHRKLRFDTAQELLEITDWFSSPTPIQIDQCCIWNLHWAPEIQLLQHEDHAWIIMRKEKPLALLTSTLSFNSHEDIASPTYGVLEETQTLQASYPVHCDDHRIIRIRRF